MDCAGSNTLGHTGGGGGLTLGAHRCRSYTSNRNVRTVEELRININLDVFKITIRTAIKEDRQYPYIMFDGTVYRVFFIEC